MLKPSHTLHTLTNLDTRVAQNPSTWVKFCCKTQPCSTKMPKRCRRISDTSEMIEWFGMDYLIQRIYADLFQMSTGSLLPCWSIFHKSVLSCVVSCDFFAGQFACFVKESLCQQSNIHDTTQTWSPPPWEFSWASAVDNSSFKKISHDIILMTSPL